MAQAFSNSQFKGYDFSREAIANAQTEAQQLELTIVISTRDRYKN